MKDKYKWEADQNKRFKEWYDKIPHVPFNEKWDVRAVPPFGGAIVRYKVQHNGHEISIYLDAYDALGCVGEPYWEIYPNLHGDTLRFLMNETKEMVKELAEIMSEKKQ